MSKFVRAAQTSQSLSLVAMEEASRLGVREADIEHLLLALVLNDQNAGRALRSLGVDIEAARQAVAEQHDTHLASLGIDAEFPAPGRIVFHETDGYQWRKRASDLLARSAGKGRDGDAGAVLRELLIEPSGLIVDILERLGVTPQRVREELDRLDASPPVGGAREEAGRGRVSGSTETFVPAPIAAVWEFLTDVTRVPEWDVSVGSIDDGGSEGGPGGVWEGRAPEKRPDGRPLKLKPQYRRRVIELVEADEPGRVTWRSSYPDVAHRGPTQTTFVLAPTTGGTQITVTTSWARSRGWRRIVALPLRPVVKFIVWLSLFQTGGAISRAFR